MAQHPLLRPFAELDLCDELGLGEARGLLRLLADEWRGVAREWRELAREHRELLLAEARAHLAGEAELAALEVAHQQRSDLAGAPALPGQPAADHELLALLRLDLDPVASALARLVGAVEPLGHDPLEPLLGGRVEQPLAAADAVRRRLPCRPVQAQLLEPRAALGIGEAHQIVAV